MGLLQDVWKIATGRAVAVDIEAEVERRIAERLSEASRSNAMQSVPTPAVQDADLGSVFPVTSEHLFVGTGWVFREENLHDKDDPFEMTIEPKKEPDAIITDFKDGWVKYNFSSNRKTPRHDDKRKSLEAFMRQYKPFDSTLADTLNKLKEL